MTSCHNITCRYCFVSGFSWTAHPVVIVIGFSQDVTISQQMKEMSRFPNALQTISNVLQLSISANNSLTDVIA